MKSHAKTVVRHAKDHFIPHKGNGHRPHVLKHRVLLGYTAIAVLLKALAIAVAIGMPKVPLFADALTPFNVIDLTNQTRESAGLEPLAMNEPLMRAATAKARDMLANQYFSHTSPSGTTPWFWIRQAGYRYERAAENLAVHYMAAEDVEAGWLASAGHRKNIMNPLFEETGVGVVFGRFEGADTAFVVQLFGAPASDVAALTAASTPAVVKNVATTIPPPVLKPTVRPIPASSQQKKNADIRPDETVRETGPGTEADLVAPATTTIPTASPAGIERTGSDDFRFLFSLPEPQVQPKVLGIATIDQFSGWMRNISIALLAFVTCSLFLALAVRFKVHHIGTLIHAMAVIGFTTTLILWS